MLSIDTETTGLDFQHGARPFFVTTCDDQGEQCYWEWNVNPLTREVIIPERDLREIQALISGEVEKGGRLVLQNGKFDVGAFGKVMPDFGWPWNHTDDTLVAAHLLWSGMPKDLTSLAVQYLKTHIQPQEDRLEQAVKACRRMVRTKDWMQSHGEWAIAKKDRPDMPSASDKTWKYDCWLPRAVVDVLWSASPASTLISGVDRTKDKGWEYHPPELGEGSHPWWTVTAEYANKDSETTLLVWFAMVKELTRRGLTAIYKEKMKVIPIVQGMEARGITKSASRQEELETVYRVESDRLGRVCRGIAQSLGYGLQMPNGAANNQSLTNFCFGKDPESILFGKPKGWLDLPIVGYTDTGAPSLDKTALDEYLVRLPPNSKQLAFITALRDKRKRDKSLTDMMQYKRFRVPLSSTKNEPPSCVYCDFVCTGRVCNGCGSEQPPPEWYVLFPSLNPTGTATLRFSSQKPNEQNISKKEQDCMYCRGEGKDRWGNKCDECKGTGVDKRSLRYLFGPAPGREWWSLDYENIELRIPAYESGEQGMVSLFEKPDDAPFFGSYHLLNASIIYPDLFWPLADQKGAFKKKYNATWYQWCKNAGFALIYGCQERKFDATAKKPGAYAALRAKLPALFRLNDRWIAYAEKYGYVETLPDKTVDPTKGYPIMCSRTEHGKIKPTVPLNYHVQSTAMWCTAKAMVRWQDKLDEWRKGGFDGWMVMQVHDEIVADFPKSSRSIDTQKADKFRQPRDTYWRIKVLQRLMEKSGEDIGIPLKVAITHNKDNWAEGVGYE